MIRSSLFSLLLAILAAESSLAFCPPIPSLGTRQRHALYASLEESAHPSKEMPPLGTERSGIRFLGKGESALVKTGVVLVAPQHEYHHYYRHAAIFLYAMGEDEHGVSVARGLILDHPTPFTLEEMMPDNIDVDNPLAKNFLFRGGDKGGDGVTVLHNRPELAQSAIGDDDDTGLSPFGIYQGGWEAALAACRDGSASVDDFKFWFNYCEFTEQELEDLMQSDEDGDGWMAVEVAPHLVLDSHWDRGEAWARLRNAVAQMSS